MHTIINALILKFKKGTTWESYFINTHVNHGKSLPDERIDQSFCDYDRVGSCTY